MPHDALLEEHSAGAVLHGAGDERDGDDGDDDEDDADHAAHLLPHALLVLVGRAQLLHRLAGIVDRLGDGVLDLVEKLAKCSRRSRRGRGPLYCGPVVHITYACFLLANDWTQCQALEKKPFVFGWVADRQERPQKFSCIRLGLMHRFALLLRRWCDGSHCSNKCRNSLLFACGLRC